MDHIIREAADNHHPAYNDKAWEKMEIKLDKHLPQKSDRRRLIFFLVFFLLVGAGTIFVLNNRFANDKQIVSEKNDKNKTLLLKENTISDDDVQKPESLNSTAQVVEPADEKITNTLPVVSESDNKIFLGKPQQQNKTVKSKNDFANDLTDVNDAIRTNQKQSNSIKPKLLNGQKKSKYDFANLLTVTDDIHKSHQAENKNAKRRVAKKSKTEIKIAQSTAYEEMQPEDGFIDKKKLTVGKTVQKLKVSITNADAENDGDASSASVLTTDKKTQEDKAKQDDAKDTLKSETDKKLPVADKLQVSKSDKKKRENKFSNNFGLTFSVGPDVSFVKLNNTGRTTLTYGAGLSYNFAKHFTARAGFYVSKKVYIANPDQYHNPGGNYPYLISVNANCKVYEIPVSVSYSFAQRRKHNWFGNVGFSSFIMKREDYTYNYKNPAGLTYEYYQKFNNKNKHYFAVLNLSGGYQYQVKNWLSIQAEPYLKLPLSGVGQGKIKLSSTGILFTVTVKPFKKKK